MRRHALWKILLRRLATIPLSVLVIATLTFALVRFVPGDPVLLITGGEVSEEQRSQIMSELGLDRPISEQYWSYMGGLVRGDLGNTYFGKRPVREEILRHLPSSIELVVLGLAVAGGIGIVFGVAAAYYPRRLPGRVGNVLITVLQAVPHFVVALYLIFFLFFLWKVAPAPSGRLGLRDVPPTPVTGFLLIDTALTQDWAAFRSALSHAVLPALALGIHYAAGIGLISKGALAHSLASPHAEYARAIGLRESTVVAGALSEAKTTILTYGAMLLAGLVGGAVIIEQIFSWNGLAQWGLQGINRMDIPVIQGFIVVTGTFSIVVYILLDLLVLRLDPRKGYG